MALVLTHDENCFSHDVSEQNFVRALSAAFRSTTDEFACGRISDTSPALQSRCSANLFAALRRGFDFVAVSAFYDNDDIPRTRNAL
jgi:hypothetical protein